jgi:uncharacterized protein YaiI (UPF0178 family)
MTAAPDSGSPDFKPLRIFIDGDACPVKDETLKVAARHHLPVVIVSNGGLRPSRDPMVTHVVVAKSADAADDWIAEHILPGEIVVTADIPLAARVIEKAAHPIGPNGRPFTPDSIGMALAMRQLNQHLRETGEIRGANAAFTKADRSRFLGELDRLARRMTR